MTTSHTVPIDQRWLGLDRRAIPSAIVASALIAMLIWLHSGWDNASAIGIDLFNIDAGGLFLMPLMIVIGVVAVVWLGVDSSRSERVWAHAILEPEVAGGVLTEVEARVLSGTHRDRRHFITSVHGHHARRTAKHVLEAGRDLCEALGRSGGDDSADVRHARKRDRTTSPMTEG